MAGLLSAQTTVALREGVGGDTHVGALIRADARTQNCGVRDELFGGRSASDSVPPANGPTPEEDRQASAEAIAGALSRAPIKVENKLGVTLQLDGQALETKIMQVNERQNYETLSDLKTTTER